MSRAAIYLALVFSLVSGLAAQGPGLEDGEDLFDDVFTEPSGWSSQAELSYVLAQGNAETETLGFRGVARRHWNTSSFQFSASGLRAENTQTRRALVGTSVEDAQLVERSFTQLTAERFRLRGRFENRVWGSLLWFAGAGWDKNEFAGIKSRTSGVLGLGNQWLETVDTRFRTLYGLTYTSEDEVISRPGREDTYAGLRLSSELLRRVTDNSRFENEIVYDLNADETEDWRLEMTNSLVVSMSSRLAVKVSLELLYDNDRAVTAVIRESPTGVPTGEFATVQLDELDTLFIVAFVVDF